jgi:ribonucleoside-diphosphate reductase alpha chain
MFLDDTACNLASLNLLQFRRTSDGKRIDIADYEHAVRLWTMVLEISVLMAQFPSKEIAQLSYKYRTLGLGYANIGGLLMTSGIPYDSEEGRAICGALTAIMTGVAYATSAEMAGELGPFPATRKTPRTCCASCATTAAPPTARSTGYEGLSVNPVPLDPCQLPRPGLIAHATAAWDKALALGEKHGYRNAQATVIAPTGTIGLVMDCDTTGIEPDFRAGEVQEARRRRLLQDHQPRGAPRRSARSATPKPRSAEIEAYAVGHGTLNQAPGINHGSLKAKGFVPTKPRPSRRAGVAFDIKFVFNKWTLGEDFCKTCSASPTIS